MPYLGVFPGYAYGPICDMINPRSRYISPGKAYDAILGIKGETVRRVNITNHSHPITKGSPKFYTIRHEDRGLVLLPKDYAKVVVLGRCHETGSVEMLACEYGEGRVFVTTTKPESGENGDRGDNG